MLKGTPRPTSQERWYIRQDSSPCATKNCSSSRYARKQGFPDAHEKPSTPMSCVLEMRNTHALLFIKCTA
eukprot:824750-Pelagomonas_calceolata.AAC.6